MKRYQQSSKSTLSSGDTYDDMQGIIPYSCNPFGGRVYTVNGETGTIPFTSFRDDEYYTPLQTGELEYYKTICNQNTPYAGIKYSNECFIENLSPHIKYPEFISNYSYYFYNDIGNTELLYSRTQKNYKVNIYQKENTKNLDVKIFYNFILYETDYNSISEMPSVYVDNEYIPFCYSQYNTAHNNLWGGAEEVDKITKYFREKLGSINLYEKSQGITTDRNINTYYSTSKQNSGGIKYPNVCNKRAINEHNGSKDLFAITISDSSTSRVSKYNTNGLLKYSFNSNSNNIFIPTNKYIVSINGYSQNKIAVNVYYDETRNKISILFINYVAFI